MTIKAPFPWFGGKSLVAPEVWLRFGDVPNYIEPFFGSGAVLLGRPTEPRVETINDLDGYVANFWRALSRDPKGVANWAYEPVNEADLHAKHVWLLSQKEKFLPTLMANPDFFDARVAGYWAWGQSCWIGSGWCSGNGPWVERDGQLVIGDAGQGITRQLPHLGNAGQGITRQLPHLGNAGRGITRQLPHLGNAGREYFINLAKRLEKVRVCCGDWSRICGPAVTFKIGLTGVFLDPPYGLEAGRDMDIYAQDSNSVAHDVWEWAVANGDNPLLRIALCGYEGEHNMPNNWECLKWKGSNGYQSNNGHRERVWFSPHCLKSQRLKQALLPLEVEP